MLGADEHDAVDLGRVALRRAAGDGDLVLARQVKVVALGEEEAHHLVELRPAVKQLVGVEPGDGTARDVPNGIAASPKGSQPDRIQRGEHLAELLDLQPVQLHVLARRKLGVVAPELLRQLADGTVLGRRQDAAGHFDAQHEVADLRLVLVQAVPLEAHHVLFGDVEVVPLAELVDLVDDLQRELVTLQALDVVALEDQVPVGCGPGRRRRWRWSWSGFGHGAPPIGCVWPQATTVSESGNARAFRFGLDEDRRDFGTAEFGRRVLARAQ